MKIRLSTMAREEGGKILVMALVLLVVGVLLLTPLLGLMSTGLTAGQVYERKTAELYAADAGVEDAIHWLLHGRPHNWDWTWDEDGLIWTRSSPIHINDKSVMVTLEGLPTPNFFRITSTATSTGQGSTTVVSTVWAIPKFTGCYEEDGLNLGTKDEMTIEGDLYVEGTVTLEQHSELVVTGGVFIDGDLILENKTSVTADIICLTGDIELANNTEINADYIHFLGMDCTLTIPEGASNSIVRGKTQDKVNIQAEGNLTFHILSGNDNRSEVKADVYAPDGAVTVRFGSPNAELQGHIYAKDSVSIISDNHNWGTHDGCQYTFDEEDGMWVSDDGCPAQEDPPFEIPPCPVMTTNPAVTYTYEIT